MALETPSPDRASGAAAGADHARLDDAMRRADELLVDSLRRDEVRRRRRRRTRLLITGGVVMTAIVCVLLAGIFASRTEAKDAKALTTDGWRLWQQLKYPEAEAKFVEAVRLDPSQPHAWNGLGWSRYNQGKSAEAVEPFKRALTLEPDHYGAANGLGQIYFAQGKLDEAERHLLRAAAGEASPAFYGLAKLYLLRGDYDRALPWALLIVRESPGDADAREILHAARTRKLDDKLRKLIEPAKK